MTSTMPAVMSENREPEPIAIVGMGCRWAGGIRDVSGLWEFLINKRSGYQDWQEPRFSAEGFYHPNPERPGTTAAKGGYVVTEDPRLFDPAFFGISGLEAETIDPSQRKLLEVIYEAFESAGDTWESVNGTRTGVYVADISYDNSYAQTRDWEYARPHATTGVCHNILSNRINYLFNLLGPSVTLDSACTSALYALHMAMQAIRDGDCDSAIVATANWIMDPAMQIAMDKLGALSATSMSHAFDASADGYARGEGFAAIYLKKPEKAVQDMSPMRALVRASAIGANGRSSGITHPSGVAQEGIIRKAYENSGGLKPSETPFLECHGTGTRVGDPLEVEAAGKVFGPGRSDDDPLLIGSVKTNLGHTEGAAALAGIFKVVLALEEGIIPPSIGVNNLNPRIDFDKAKAKVLTEVVPWPKGKLRRASVTSAGFGGSIGHCIIDHVNVVYPEYVKPGIMDKTRLNGSIANGSALNGNGITHTNGVNGSTYTNGTNGHAHTNGTNGHTHTNGTNGHAHTNGTNGHAHTNGTNGHTKTNGINGHTHTNGYHDDTNGTNGDMHVNGAAYISKDTAQNGSKTTNHLPILDTLKKIRKADADTRELVLLCFSAHNDSSINANIDALSGVIDQHSLADVAYTLADRRSKLSQRTFRVVDKTSVTKGLQEDVQKVFSSPPEVPRLGFVFTGQGAQWPAMGAELFEYRVFRTAIEHLDSVVASLPHAPSWAISDILSGNCEAGREQSPEISQTVCTAVQIGLVDLLASWSVHASGVVGHSSGEMAAAYAAGRMTAAESITAAYYRGQAVSQNKKKGAMLAVGLGPAEAAEYLGGLEQAIKIAAINSPGSVTLSGEEEDVKKLSETLEQDGVFNRLLKTGGNAYHSQHMVALGHIYDDMLASGLDHLDKLGLRDTRHRYHYIPWASSVTPDKSMPADSVPSSYWKANLQSPVRFSDAVANLVGREVLDIGALVEIGPHPALKSPLDQILKSIGKTNIPYAGSLKRGEDGRRSVLQLAGSLFGLDAQIDLAAVNATDEGDADKLELAHGVTAKNLPPFQYTYGPIAYHEGRLSKEFRLRKVPRHDLVGSKMAGGAKLRPQFRNVLRMNDLPWLGDHRLLPDTVFPAAGYMAMAMVAASQNYNEFPTALPIVGYSLRNIDIKTALQIPEDQSGIEIIFSMELLDSATAEEPAWASFAVSSVGGDSEAWTEHCTGQVKVDVSGQAIDSDKISMPMESRAVDARLWYKKFESIGLGYGPTFQALSEISADPVKNLACAKLGLNTTAGIVKGGESSYPIHPASLDSMIQLGLLSCHGGQTDRATTAFVPIHMSHMYLRAGNDQEWGTAFAQGEFRGLRSAYLQLQLQNQEGDVLLDVKDLRCISYSLEKQSPGKTSTRPFASPFTRMIYKPDFRALNNQQARTLFPPPPKNVIKTSVLDRLETIAALIAVDVYDTLINRENNELDESETTTGLFISWIRRLVEQGRSDKISGAKQLNPSDRLQALQDLYKETGDLIETKSLQRLHDNMEDILKNRTAGEEVLAEGGLLADFFDNSLFLTGVHPQVTQLFDSIGHANPGLRILDIKGGKGHTASLVLDALSSTNGIKRYQDYTVTDISDDALQTARGNLAEARDVNFSVLDINEDPLQQGYQPTYDIVVASQAIHTTPYIAQALENAKKLLKPGGKLVLVEATANSVWVGMVGGVQAGYWHGLRDGRVESPFLDVTAWDTYLRKAGFSGTELVLDDYPQPTTYSNIVVSTLLAPDQRGVHAGPNLSEPGNASVDAAVDTPVVWLLHGAKGTPTLLKQLASKMADCGLQTKTASIDTALNKVPTNARVVAFLDDENLLLDADKGRFEIFQYLALSTASMVWLTSTGMAEGRSPDGAVVGGLLRTISTESPTGRFFSIDIDADNFEVEEKAMNELVRVVVEQEQALQEPGDEEGGEDREFAWHSGCLWVSRLVPETALHRYAEPFTTPETHSTEMLPLDSQGPVRAAFETPGLLSSLYFRPHTELRQQLLPRDWIEVKVAAVGLNWKDLALATGRFDGNNLSSEYAGVITSVGSDVVSRFAVGDRVYGLGKGNFGNYTRVPAALAQKARPEDNLVDLATLPVVFMTAVYAFEHLTRLRKGQKVLIQSASGGVGLGAIQLARAKGADVFAMAGSPDKVRFLVETVGLPRSNVFAARDLTELANATAATHNGGFDVILSTSQGDMLYETIKTLAPLGHLIDIGRLDVNQAGTVGLELFQKSASFSSFDLARVVDRDPELGAELIHAADEHYRAGRIGPIQPLAPSDISQLDQTLRDFSKGEHVGKLVVTFQNPDSLVRMVPAAPTASFDPDACYVVTGGLSGLGRSIMRWMGDRGACELVVLSRRGPSAPEAQTLVEDLAERGVRVRPIACDLSKQEAVASAIEQASAEKPVKGIIHCAVSYQDISFDKLPVEGWRDGLAAKVLGTRNLHEATKALSLDFFVMTTSILSVLSFATQAAYTAANNFQDQFARYRRRLGLPATAAQFGLVNDVGHLSTDETTVELMVRNKVLTVPESYFLRLLEPAFLGRAAADAAAQSSGIAADPLAAATYVTYMDPAHMAAQERDDREMGLVSVAPPRWHGDARVSHVIRAMEDALRADDDADGAEDGDERGGGRSSAAKLRRRFDEATQKARAAPAGAEQTELRGEALELATDAVRATVAAMLKMDVAAVNAARSVADHGVDSLIAAELRNWFHVALGSKISMVKLLEPRTTISALVGSVVDAAIEGEKE